MDLTQKQLAELFGCSTRAVRIWNEEGLSGARSGTRGLYDGRKAVAWFVEREARKLIAAGAYGGAEDEETGEELNKSEWDARYARARALAAEDDIELARGNLVERHKVEDVLGRAAGLVKSLPRREATAAARVLGCQPRDAIPLLERLSDQVLGLLREAMPDEEEDE